MNRSTDERGSPLHIITRKRLKEFWEKHQDAEAPLRAWYKVASRATWQNLAETRQDFPHADPVGACTIFNIGGNKYRLIAVIRYQAQRVYIIRMLTHKEYNTEKWKHDCYC